MGFYKGKTMHSLLSFGEVLIDLLPDSIDNNNYIPLAGGAPANVAVAYAKLGGSAYFAGGVSDDNFGEMLMNQLTLESVDTRYVEQIKNANTALVLVSLDMQGERSFNFYRHNTADMQYSRSQSERINWQNIGIFHYCSNTLTNEVMAENTFYNIESAKKNNVLISFDVNLRLQLWQDVTLLPSKIDACISKSDIVKLSKDEAEYLANEKQIDLDSYYAHLLAQNVKLILVSDGANAVKLITKNNYNSFKVPSITAIDTTAAGDSFIGGFLFHLAQLATSKNQTLLNAIEQPKLLSLAVLSGIKCGSFTCQNKGAFSALPTRLDI
jgi:fructokinase